MTRDISLTVAQSFPRARETRDDCRRKVAENKNRRLRRRRRAKPFVDSDFDRSLPDYMDPANYVWMSPEVSWKDYFRFSFCLYHSLPCTGLLQVLRASCPESHLRGRCPPQSTRARRAGKLFPDQHAGHASGNRRRHQLRPRWKRVGRIGQDGQSRVSWLR